MINFLIYIPVILTLAGLAFFVYLQNPKVAHNRLFAITVVLILGWSTSLLFADTASNIANSLLAIRVAILFASLIPLFYLYFSLIFPFSSQISKLKYALLAIPAIALSLSSFSPQMIRSVHYEGLGAQIDEFGALYVLLGLYFAIYFISSFIILFRKRKHSLRASAQIKLIIWGSVVTVLLNLFSNFVFVALDMTQYTILFGAPTVILFVATMAYVIVRHRLFDIRLVVARSLAYALVILTLGLVYGYFVFGFVDQFFPDTGTSTLQQAFYTISAVFLVFTFQPLKRFFDKLTNRLFYQDSYDSEDVLNRLGKVFVAKSNSFDLLDDSLDIIVDTLKVEFGRLIVLGNDGIYKATHIGSSEEIKVDITDLEKLEDKITILDEVSGKEVESTLNDMNTYVAVKLATNEGLVGYLLLGTKRSGTIYTKQDINLLEILSQELAVAIENAKSYQEIQAFSETLKKEVEDATAKLRETNQRLVKLDEAKDEFISMASHQLRTPLTTVKGYLSMLLEGDAGKLSKKQSEFIDLAFVSSKRMVHLIADMLNVSRISTGKLTIDKEEIDMVELVEEEVNQLHRQAEARNVKLTLHKPKEKIPKLVLDETKIRQVVMNFTDNAIYYAPEGKVDVYIESQDNAVEFRVEDNGIGVSQAAQKELFKKFFRAENAKTVRPDGTGLGLYMAKQVIEIQGGEIIFSSEEGKGSVFGFGFNIGSESESKDQHQDKEDNSA